MEEVAFKTLIAFKILWVTQWLAPATTRSKLPINKVLDNSSHLLIRLMLEVLSNQYLKQLHKLFQPAKVLLDQPNGLTPDLHIFVASHIRRFQIRKDVFNTN